MREGAFLSHFQANGGPTIHSMQVQLRKLVPFLNLWLDINQADVSEAAMREGVINNCHFVLLLTKGIFQRWFVANVEIPEALRAGRTIVLVHATDETVGYVNFGVSAD